MWVAQGHSRSLGQNVPTIGAGNQWEYSVLLGTQQ